MLRHAKGSEIVKNTLAGDAPSVNAAFSSDHACRLQTYAQRYRGAWGDGVEKQPAVVLGGHGAGGSDYGSGGVSLRVLFLLLMALRKTWLAGAFGGGV